MKRRSTYCNRSRQRLVFNDILDYLNQKQESKIVLGLDRVKRVLAALGDPQKRLKAIHVAGTNGKGSVCQMFYSVLREAGYSVGLYTSPHLHELTERIVINGTTISEEEFVLISDEIRTMPGHEELTYFEFITCVAFAYFERAKVDYVVLETGLGGRLDATNVLEHPLLSIVTTIDFDHMSWLGSTLEAIASEKAGIFKKSSPALVGQVPPITLPIFEQAAKGAAVESLRFTGEGDEQTQYYWELGYQEFFHNDKKIQLTMLGEHQRHNALLVLEALSILQEQYGIKMAPEAIILGLRKTNLPGRWDLRQSDGKTWVFDVAHNPQAVYQHKKTIDCSPWKNESNKLLIAGFLKDKNYELMLKQLIPYYQSIWLVEPKSDRACSTASMLACLSPEERLKSKTAPSISAAIDLARGDNNANFISVLGSFRVIAPALETFNSVPV